MSPSQSSCTGAVALAALLLGIVSAVPVPAETDPGYESLFTTNNESMFGFVSEPGPVPIDLIGGSYIIPSLGQFEMGDQKVQGLFDAFGKLHRFGFNANGSMSFACK